ncbi:hypothetical protein EVAR_23657_1 [Eumeta japonica]|uniref:Uncharacterized protein n=1 Tax=Eumeta variegata TaxID=151549 RepID=A0A4C1VIV2_EUMVA|nr:hypothetical protein EVAR_23657_1 [Eumeta japonica]
MCRRPSEVAPVCRRNVPLVIEGGASVPHHDTYKNSDLQYLSQRQKGCISVFSEYCIVGSSYVATWAEVEGRKHSRLSPLLVIAK